MKRLQRRCEQRLSGIAVPHPFDLDTFCETIATHRGRRLNLQPIPGLSFAAPCGLWISMAQADYVLYDPNTSRLHAEHIILHELGHILSDHRSATSLPDSTLTRLMPDLDPKMIERMLGRASYTSAQEREAEMLASLIRSRAATGGAALPRDVQAEDPLARLADVFRFRQTTD